MGISDKRMGLLKSLNVMTFILVSGSVTAVQAQGQADKTSDAPSINIQTTSQPYLQRSVPAAQQADATHMDSEKNKRIVKETWDAFWRGDVEAGVANMSDDITWLAPGSNKMSGLKVGKDAIRQFRFTELGVFRDLKRNVVGLYGDGDTVVLEVKAEGHLRNGEPYENAGCVVWQLRDGKIAHVRQYVDTQKAMALNQLFKEGPGPATLK
jgi:uncharacterized protein